MAKFNWIQQITIEGLVEALKLLSPLLLPVLTMIGQQASQVPWPYFFAALAVSIGAAIWVMVSLSTWRQQRQIDNRLIVTLDAVIQSVQEDDTTKCRYRLLFKVFNSCNYPLSMCVNSFKWELAGRAAAASDIIKTQAMAPPGGSTLWGSTIDGLAPGHHDGKFEIKIGLGTKFEEQEFELETLGSFKITSKTPRPENASLPFSQKIMKISAEKL